MNKTLKRRVFRHTALYAAILMFSHTGGGGGAGDTHNSALVLAEKKRVKGKDKRSKTHQSEKKTGRTMLKK
ncbi:hypothetical protein I7J91_10920, partial [Neisseria meningitidis]|nr:hypothetical protein [Neisseria meningitidis]